MALLRYRALMDLLGAAGKEPLRDQNGSMEQVEQER